MTPLTYLFHFQYGTCTRARSSMYHLHIYMKDMVGFEAILHSLNDEKHHFWNICSLYDTLNLNPHE